MSNFIFPALVFCFSFFLAKTPRIFRAPPEDLERSEIVFWALAGTAVFVLTLLFMKGGINV